ncbi:hypothetical protein CH338_22170, partial [Rhodoplanes elegans]
MSGTVSIRMILRAVGYAFGIPSSKIRSLRRTGDLCQPRHAVCLLAREMTTLTFPAIGRLLGDRDHTSIMHGADKGQALRDSDPDFARRLATAREMILAELARADRWQDADAVAAAERVMGAADPWRAAIDLSVDEVVAVAARAVALEHVAAGTYRLLAQLDELRRCAERPRDGDARDRIAELEPAAAALSDALAEALQGLGYEYAEPADEPTSEPKDETDGQA